MEGRERNGIEEKRRYLIERNEGVGVGRAFLDRSLLRFEFMGREG